jgi:hypothetical protein
MGAIHTPKAARLATGATARRDLQKTRPSGALSASFRPMSLAAKVDLPVEFEPRAAGERPTRRREPHRASPEELPRGGAFLTPAERSERSRKLADAGYLVARVALSSERGELTGPGSLAEALTSAVEISLALRGALPPAVEIDAGIAATARDQLFRMRVLEAAGLCLVLPPLAAIAVEGALHADDAAVLRHFQRLSEHEPVVLLFDAADRELSILAPQPLEQFFAPEAAPPSGARTLPPPHLVGMVPDDAPTRPWGAHAAGNDDDPLALDADLAADLDDDLDDDLVDLTPEGLAAILEDEEDEEDELDDHEPLDEELLEEEPRDEEPRDEEANLEEANLEEDSLEEDSLEEPIADEVREARPLGSAGSAASHRPPSERGRLIRRDPLDGIDMDDLDDDEDLEGADFEDVAVAAVALAREPSKGALAPVAPAEVATAERGPALPSPQECERHCRALDAARGPKPVRVIEELFTTRYLPLREALSRGLDDLDVEDVVAEWAESFAKSYQEGFKTMRLTGKRPTMVLDAPEVATRIGRAHGARAVQLVLVDAMRFDLGQRVQEALSRNLDGGARCVEETILWSALPAITPTQMRLLTQGARGLRENEPASERDPEAGIHRAGSVSTLRRVRIGQRDLVKLDLVEARLREAGAGYDARLSSIAAEVAEVVASFAASLPPRTLLFVFGDHGFELPVASSRATGSGKQGGASPDEILVGAQAWLLGAPADRT